MTAWAAKRFWTKASAEPCDGGFTVRLDDKPVRTPLKHPLILPTLPMAEAIVAEWDAQSGKIDPASMPSTRFANSAIDKVRPQLAEVVAIIAAYGATDLLCYRAIGPADLVARQSAAWDPLLAWVADAAEAPLNVTIGVVPIDQPGPSLAALGARVSGLTPFQIAAFHDLVAISGSLVLALAIASRHIDAETAWSLSRIDEDWQAEQWGDDEDALAVAALRKGAFLQADRFLALCG